MQAYINYILNAKYNLIHSSQVGNVWAVQWAPYIAFFPPACPGKQLKLWLSGPDSMGLYIEDPVTELAVSVRFQAHSSVLAASAPAANYKPTQPLHRTPAQLSQESQCPTKAQPGKEKRSRLDSVSAFPEASSKGRGKNRDVSIRGCNVSELDILYTFPVQVCYMADPLIF